MIKLNPWLPPLFVGRTAEQIDEFLEEEIQPILETNANYLAVESIDGVNV